VIGGLAVVHHGYSRDTADLDLLICKLDRGAWLGLFQKLHYELETERPSFIHFKPPARGAWPVDLMLVSEATFKTMLDASSPIELYGATVKMPALEHLLALKLHALKHSHVGRYAKDLLDVEALVRVNGLDIKSEKMQQLFLKYGSFKIYEQVSRF